MMNEGMLYEEEPAGPLWQVAIPAGLPGERAQEIADGLEDMCLSVALKNRDSADGDVWDILLIVPGEPDGAALEKRLSALGCDAAPVIAKVEQKDWLKEVHKDFPPVTVGPFFVYGSHYEGAVPEGLIPLRVDAATAFGSGEHETTQGCLLALSALKQAGAEFSRGLDMGCGSGILAVAMKKLWPGMAVFASDIDPESVTVTERHAALNDAALTVGAGDGYAAPVARDNGPYDLIVANILAGPLVAMAGDLAAALAPGGTCVLSGLLARQMEEVSAAHVRAGLKAAGSHPIGVWDTLSFEKTA